MDIVFRDEQNDQEMRITPNDDDSITILQRHLCVDGGFVELSHQLEKTARDKLIRMLQSLP